MRTWNIYIFLFPALNHYKGWQFNEQIYEQCDLQSAAHRSSAFEIIRISDARPNGIAPIFRGKKLSLNCNHSSFQLAAQTFRSLSVAKQTFILASSWSISGENGLKLFAFICEAIKLKKITFLRVDCTLNVNIYVRQSPEVYFPGRKFCVNNFSRRNVKVPKNWR